MIPSPFRLEQKFNCDDFEKIGRLSLRWSHIDHMIGNCLKIMLRLSDDEANIVVFPLSTELRLTRIRELNKLTPFPTEAATRAFKELDLVMKGIQAVRNNVVHAVVMGPGKFELRSKKKRSYSKDEIFSVEELTNYAALAVLILRHELGEIDPEYDPPSLPQRPQVPKFLQSLIHAPHARYTNAADRKRMAREAMAKLIEGGW
jgi:hypothetical protein